MKERIIYRGLFKAGENDGEIHVDCVRSCASFHVLEDDLPKLAQLRLAFSSRMKVAHNNNNPHKICTTISHGVSLFHQCHWIPALSRLCSCVLIFECQMQRDELVQHITWLPAEPAAKNRATTYNRRGRVRLTTRLSIQPASTKRIRLT